MEDAEEFSRILGPEAAKALAEWAAMMRFRVKPARVLVNGRSSATVMVLYKTPYGQGTRAVLLKHDAVAGDKAGTAEYARQRQALAEAGDFRPHLAGLAHEPIRVGDGTWITLQDYVDDPDTPVVLTSLLAGVGGTRLEGLQAEPVYTDGAVLAEACARVVGSILDEWVVDSELRLVPVAKALRDHFDDRLDPGAALADLAQQWRGATIRVGGEELLNPFALLDQHDTLVPFFPGKGHGDLHTENILVAGDRFWLIDLARYTNEAPVSQDPMQLLLSIVNRAGLAPEHHEALLAELVDGRSDGLPGWLLRLVTAVRQATLTWAAKQRLSPEWNTALRLSTVACALIFAARKSTTAPNRAFFLRLAGRLAARFAGGPAVRSADESTATPPPPRPADPGIAELCNWLRTLRQNPATERESEDLVSRARAGEDVHEELVELLERAGVEVGGSRSGGALPGMAGTPIVGEAFGCPRSIPCGRTRGRRSGAAKPRCEFDDKDMIPVARPL